jgi:hypothetical protein
MTITLNGTTGITTPGLTNTGTETIVDLTTTGNTTLGDATTDTLTVGVTGIVKNSSGNVGIGTATVATNFRTQFLGTAGSNTSAASSGTTQAASAVLRLQAGGGFTGTLDIGQGGGTGSWLQSCDTSDLSTTYSLLLNPAGGNVGIGTSSPNTKLQASAGSSGSGVVNTLRLQNVGTSAGDGARILFTAGTSTDGAGIASTGVSLNAADLRFYSGSSVEAMRLDTSGNLLVGKTSSATAGQGIVLLPAGTYQSSVNGTAAAYHATFYNNAGSTPASVGGIFSSGSTTTYSTSSDYRLKNVTGTLTGYKERLMAVQPKQGFWKVDDSEFRGFLAHEFAISYPSSVTGEKDAIDANGKLIIQGMQAATSEVMADLIALVQEQQALIQSLTTRLTALENK